MLDAATVRRAFSDPVRVRILGRLQVPRAWTAKELADELGVKANGLYYHLKLLEEAGLVEIVGTRPAGRMLERLYKGTGHRPAGWSNSGDPTERTAIHAARLDAAKVDVEEAVYEQAEQTELGESMTSVDVITVLVNTTQAEIAEFRKGLLDLIAEYLQRSGPALESAPDETYQLLRVTAAVTGRTLPSWWTTRPSASSAELPGT